MVQILGFMGSPRFGGNTDTLLDALLVAAEAAGASTEKIRLGTRKITPCIECAGCDETAVCVLEDGMAPIYDKIVAADVVVVASPIFFYNITSATQALIERSQANWIGKFVLKRGLLGGKSRRGIFVSLGATKGKRLFDGVLMVLRYYFEAIDADFAGALLYRGIEAKGAVNDHPTALDEAREVGRLLAQERDLSALPYLYRP